MTKRPHLFLEQGFFVILFAFSGFLLYKLFSPFLGALALSAIIATICYPIYERVKGRIARDKAWLASLITLLVIVLLIVIPISLIGSFILREAIAIYTLFNSSGSLAFISLLENAETLVQTFIPEFTFDMAGMVQQTAQFFVDHLLSFFAGTASTILLTFIGFIGCYYFFKDGKYFTSFLIKMSPLKDMDDSLILSRLARAVRSVAIGTVAIAIIQGVLAGIGLSIAGFDRAIFLGCLASIGALVPGVGTAIVLVPATIYLFVTGSEIMGAFLLIWGIVAVGLIDNILGPYLMSKGSNVHPFLILLSVLGGITLMGPIGFVLGPVILNLFLVLVSIYSEHLKT